LHIDDYRKEKLEKMLSYDKKIKESEFAPVKSAKKAKELQTLRQSLDPEFKKKRREMDREAA